MAPGTGGDAIGGTGTGAGDVPGAAETRRQQERQRGSGRDGRGCGDSGDGMGSERGHREPLGTGRVPPSRHCPPAGPDPVPVQDGVSRRDPVPDVAASGGAPRFWGCSSPHAVWSSPRFGVPPGPPSAGFWGLQCCRCRIRGPCRCRFGAPPTLPPPQDEFPLFVGCRIQGSLGVPGAGFGVPPNSGLILQ